MLLNCPPCSLCAGSNLIACDAGCHGAKGLIVFPFKYGFGIIPLLNCAKCVTDPARRGADVAQSAEHPPCKRAVTSSILVVGSASATWKVNNLTPGGYPSGQRGLTVNQLSEDFGGSNPSPPTIPQNNGTACFAHIAQSVEHTLGKGEVTGPNPVVGSVAEKFLCL